MVHPHAFRDAPLTPRAKELGKATKSFIARYVEDKPKKELRVTPAYSSRCEPIFRGAISLIRFFGSHWS